MKLQLIFLLYFFLSSSAIADSQALLIGNANYHHISSLATPLRDVNAMGQKLLNLGFKVTIRKNLNKIQMRQAIRNFSKALRTGDKALFYFSGHGIQVNSSNYLLPVSADIQRAEEIIDEAIPLDFVLQGLNSTQSRLNLVVLDASRNISFKRHLNGFARLNRHFNNTLVAFSASSNQVSEDRNSANSLYTKYLLEHLDTPNMTVQQMLNRVRYDVYRASKGKQSPMIEGSLLSDIRLNPNESQRHVPRHKQPPPSKQPLEQQRQASHQRRKLEAILKGATEEKRRARGVKERQIEETHLIMINKKLHKLKLANIEFFAPELMNIEDTKIIILSLGLKGIDISLTDAVKKEKNMRMYKEDIYISDKVKAHLVGVNFHLKEITPEIQAISMERKTVWKWFIQPLKAGKQQLSLTISALIPVQGESTSIEYKTLDKTIEIKVTIFQTIKNLVSKNSELFITTVFSILVFLFMFGREIVKKLKMKKT